MYSEVLHAIGDNAGASLAAQRRSLVGHSVRSMLAGMYVGSAVTLIFVGNPVISGTLLNC